MLNDKEIVEELLALEIVPRLQRNKLVQSQNKKQKWNWFLKFFGWKVHLQEGKRSAN